MTEASHAQGRKRPGVGEELSAQDPASSDSHDSDGENGPASVGHNAVQDFHGERRSNATHAATKDPHTQLVRMARSGVAAPGQALLCRASEARCSAFRLPIRGPSTPNSRRRRRRPGRPRTRSSVGPPRPPPHHSPYPPSSCSTWGPPSRVPNPSKVSNETVPHPTPVGGCTLGAARNRATKLSAIVRSLHERMVVEPVGSWRSWPARSCRAGRRDTFVSQLSESVPSTKSRVRSAPGAARILSPHTSPQRHLKRQQS